MAPDRPLRRTRRSAAGRRAAAGSTPARQRSRGHGRSRAPGARSRRPRGGPAPGARASSSTPSTWPTASASSCDGSSGDDHRSTRGSSGDRSARSPLARTRPSASASAQASPPVARAIQVSASELDDGRRRTPRVPHARQRPAPRRTAEPGPPPTSRRALGEEREEVFHQEPGLLAAPRVGRQRVTHVGVRRGPESCGHDPIESRVLPVLGVGLDHRVEDIGTPLS